MKTKIILLSIVSIALIVGVYFFVNYQKRLSNTIKLQELKIMTLFSFLNKSFPDQVKVFDEEISKNLEALPTNTILK